MCLFELFRFHFTQSVAKSRRRKSTQLGSTRRRKFYSKYYSSKSKNGRSWTPDDFISEMQELSNWSKSSYYSIGCNRREFLLKPKTQLKKITSFESGNSTNNNSGISGLLGARFSGVCNPGVGFDTDFDIDTMSTSLPESICCSEYIINGGHCSKRHLHCPKVAGDRNDDR